MDNEIIGLSLFEREYTAYYDKLTIEFPVLGIPTAEDLKNQIFELLKQIQLIH
jgi:hypothetical protein